MNGFKVGSDGLWYAPNCTPRDDMDYQMDLTDILGLDTLATASWSATTGIDIDTVKCSFTPLTATVWLKNATSGQDFTIRGDFTTLGGRTFSKSFKIICMDDA